MNIFDISKIHSEHSEHSELLKIPDNIIIKELKKEVANLNFEIGQLKSYTLELERKIKSKGELSQEVADKFKFYKNFYTKEKNEIMKDFKDDLVLELKNINKSLKKRNKSLQQENKKLKETNNTLFSTIAKLRKEEE